LTAFIQIQNAKSKHKKLCRQIAHLRGVDFQFRARTVFLIREYSKIISSDQSFARFRFWLFFLRKQKTASLPDIRSKNGVAEPVIGTRDFARSRWLAYDPAIHAASQHDHRNHDGMRASRPAPKPHHDCAMVRPIAEVSRPLRRI
jgi:hypothetical protein